MRPAVAALGAPERAGLDRLAGLSDGPVIFAPNHHSHLDTPTMLTSIPEPWRYKVFVAAAADYFFKTHVTSAASALALGAIPMDRSKVSRRTADQAAELIDEGWSMLIFPEGGRSPDGWGQPFRGGAAYLSNRCDVPVVPVHLEGTGKILRKGAKRPTPVPRPRHLRHPAPTRRRREHQPLRRAHRAGGGRAGRRGHHRLVAVAAPRRRRHHPAAHRPGRARLAARLGARRPLPQAPPPDPRLAEALGRVTRRRRRARAGAARPPPRRRRSRPRAGSGRRGRRRSWRRWPDRCRCPGYWSSALRRVNTPNTSLRFAAVHADAVVGDADRGARRVRACPVISMRGATSARTNLSELPDQVLQHLPEQRPVPPRRRAAASWRTSAPSCRDRRRQVGEHLRERARRGRPPRRWCPIGRRR